MNEFTTSWPSSSNVRGTIVSPSMHRTDIRRIEFCLLSKFCWALQTLKTNKSDLDSPTFERDLGEVDMCLPVWRLNDDNSWRLLKYRTYRKRAIGIDVAAMRNISRALHTTENVIVHLLYKLSMLSVDSSKPDVMGKSGMYVTAFPDHVIEPWMTEKPLGYIIEARRALGAFRKWR